ncbi:hypothetical protein [Tepidibacillus marianensis]|uniref:hypothetical protein n=1 Tax=Tepidibacillus marianensis TaxID=3131995 RepID=UPI0030D4EBA2
MMVTPQVINLLGFKMNVNERNANLSLSSIQQIDSFVSTKKNNALGDQFGNLLTILLPINFLNDSDLNDSNSAKNSVV